MEIEEIEIPVPWGFVRGQRFGTCKKNSVPILCLHGFLDNSNSFKPIASYICESNEYYMIALDLPGHGRSSPIPLGAIYTPKLFLTALRRCVLFLKISSFIFLSHSYGVGQSLLYAATFKNEVMAIVGLDYLFAFKNNLELVELWNNSIDTLIKIENEIKSSNEVNSTETKQDVLTEEKALAALLKANGNLNEEAARLLLERGLTKNENGKLEFSRDVRVKFMVGYPDHYTEFLSAIPSMVSQLNTQSILFIHAEPCYYGQRVAINTMALLERINEAGKCRVEFQKVNGSHHFHMIEPKSTALRVLTFLSNLKPIPKSNL